MSILNLAEIQKFALAIACQQTLCARKFPDMSIRPTLRGMVIACAATACLVLLGACETPQMRTPGRSSLTFDPPLKTPRNPSAVKLKLSTSAQRLYVVEGDNVLLATPVGVGKASSPTPRGNFSIYSKQATRRRVSSPGAGYPMPYWMEFRSAYGLHWGFIKPYPSTMGCVRMPLNAARKVFSVVRPGTPLHIASHQPWDGTIGKALPVLDDSRLPDPPLSYMLSPQVFSDMNQGRLWKFGQARPTTGAVRF